MQRYTAAPAMSRGCPIRPSGILRTDASCTCWIFSIGSAIGVHTKVGAIAFTRMPCVAQSIAWLRVIAATAPFVAVYTTWLGSDRSAACDARFTIDPLPRGCMSRNAAWAAEEAALDVHPPEAVEVGLGRLLAPARSR